MVGVLQDAHPYVGSMSSKRAVRRRRASRPTPEERAIRRAEEKLRESEVRARRATANMAYWQSKLRRLKQGHTEHIQPSLFGTASPEMSAELLTEQQSREKNVPMKQPLFGTGPCPAGSTTHPLQHGILSDSE